MLLSGKTQKKHLGDLPPTVPHLPPLPSTLGDSGLPIAAITAWNGLPSTITTSTSLPTLRCEPSNFDLVSTEFSYKYTWTPCDFVKYCCNVFYPHMPIGNAWIYREYCLFFIVCFCTVEDFSTEDKASSVKFCTVVHRRHGQGISHFGELCTPRSPKSAQESASACT